MDAVEFLKSYKRMCESNSRFLQIDLSRADFESMVSDAEQWSKDHPAKTRQSEFLRMFPNVKINKESGTISISPCTLDSKIQYGDRCMGRSCIDCRRDYWLQEVE